MPTDDTRHLLKAFGVAVTTLEDAVQNRLSREEVSEAEAEVRSRLQEVTLLIDRLRAEVSAPRPR